MAQNTERECPKLQVAGEIPAGTPFCGCGSTAECGCAKAGTTVRFRSPAPFQSLWCSQPTRLPLKQEITGAKPVRDTSFHAPKAFSAMHSLGKRVSPVQLRVGAPVFGGRVQAPQSNQRSGRRHEPAAPGAAPGTARHLHAGHHKNFASMQQAADFFCKEILPERHRLEAPFIWLA